MIQFNDFKFRINISRDYYEKKSDALACLSREGAKAIGKDKMAFVECTVNVSEFLEFALAGHTFCNLFSFDPNQKYWVANSKGEHYESYPLYRRGPNMGCMKISFKSDKFFRGSQVIFVDVDKTRFTDITDYLNTLRFLPTCVYMSYSDKILKQGIMSRRFRLVYVMDHVLNRDEFLNVSTAINDQIVMDTAEPMEDECGKRISQYMNGVFGNSESYWTNIIYSLDDFPTPNFDNECQDDLTCHGDTSTNVSFNPYMVHDMLTLDYTTFMHFYSTRYCYVYRLEKYEWPYVTHQFTDENYMQLWYYTEKQHDGEKRRKKLFRNACLRRLMYPDIDADTLLFNLYVDRERFFDNSDNVLSVDMLQRNVNSAMKKTREQLEKICEFEITYWREHRPTFIYRPGMRATIGLNNSIMRSHRWRNIEIGYDRLKSVKENNRTLNVSPSTLYRFCNEKGIDTMPHKKPTEKQKRLIKRQGKQGKIKIFKQLYSEELSIRENQKLLANWGVNLSVGTIRNWKERYK